MSCDGVYLLTYPTGHLFGLTPSLSFRLYPYHPSFHERMPGSFGRLTALPSLCSLLLQQPTAAHDLEGSVFRMSRDGSSIVRISAEKTGWGTASPRWTPDGQRVLYVAYTESKSEFHVVSPTGEKLMRVPVPPHITSVAGVSWVPDGTAIAFGGGTAEGSYDIYLMELGSGERAIRRIVSDGIQPAWSPNGRLLAFTTFRDGNFEVYLADSDGGNQRNLTRHEGHDGRHGPRTGASPSRATASEISRSASSR